MKRYFSLTIAAILCFVLTACGAPETASEFGSADPVAKKASPDPVAEEASPDPVAEETTDSMPPRDGAGVTTNALINETWDWIDSIPWDDRKLEVFYEEVAKRLGDDGEWIDTDTNAQYGAIHYRWNDPAGGVIRIEFRPNDEGAYRFSGGNISGTE